MSSGDIFIDILYDLFVGISADKVREIIERIFSGDGTQNLLAGGGRFDFLLQGLFDAGLDPTTLTNVQWSELAELMIKSPPASAA